MEELQQLVTAALNNANEGEWLAHPDDYAEARSLLDYDDDVYQYATTHGLTEADVARCVRAWKTERGV